MELKINEKLIKYNYSSRGGEKIKYIVIHDTGNLGHKSNADAHYNYFNSADRQSSAHYFVDDKQILRLVKDSDKSWHCGDGRGKNGITNENSIGIEMCINKDGDFSKTYNSTLLLTKHLMATYNIGIENVVRHHDASGKICPHIWAQDNWTKWEDFKNDLLKITNEKTENPEASENKVSEDLPGEKEENKPQEVDYTPIITKLYQALFKRDPDGDGLNYWIEKMKNGYSPGDVMKEMSKSEEFKNIYIAN